MNTDLSRPVSPLISDPVEEEAAVEAEPEEGWESIDDAPVLAFEEVPGRDEEVDEIDEDGSSSQIPVPVPSPPQPTQKEVDRHNLNHATYRSWCPACVGGRRPNSQHRRRPDGRRNNPLFCGDYGYVREVEDPDLLTLAIGKMYPSKSRFASACDVKGPDDEVVSRLTAFFREMGHAKIVYKTDQESSLKNMVEEALRRAGRSGTFEAFEAVPETSAVGESASNGRAERTVQEIEDMLRTLKIALETRLATRVPTSHPVTKWLVEHAATVLNRYRVNDSGKTPYEEVHGQRSTQRIVEIGEQVFFNVPKRLRAKLSRRWRLGIYLGLVNASNEHHVANSSGNVVKARSVVRVVPASRWSAEAVLEVKGTPSKLAPGGNEDIGPHLEGLDRPAADADEQLREQIDQEGADLRRRRDFIDVRITDKDLRTYGYTDNCPKCGDLQAGRRSFKAHSDECRLRVYMHWRDAHDQKYEKVKHIIEGEADSGQVDLPAEVEEPRPRPSSSRREEPAEASVVPPPTPISHAVDDEEEEPTGRWDPAAHRDLPDSPMEENEDDVAAQFMDSDDDAMDDGQDRMVSYLVTAGVPRDVAKSKVCAMMSKRPAATFMEVYGRGAIVQCANQARRDLNLQGLCAMDLRTTKPDGTPWDFSCRSDRRLARRMVEEKDPDWLIGSPPCTSFSIWNYGMNFPKMDPQRVKQAVEEGRVHLNFVASLYRL